jgi:archaellum component FlaC
MPDKGPVDTAVVAYGYGFPASNGNTYNVTLTWSGSSTSVVASAITDGAGNFIAYFNVPPDFGGGIDVWAVANDTAMTSAMDVFTITPTLVVMGGPFDNDCGIIPVYGSGFDPSGWYAFYVDNALFSEWIWVNASGEIEFELVAAGFRPGLHTVYAYQLDMGMTSPWEVVAKDCFDVTTTDDPIADLIAGIESDIDDLEDFLGDIEIYLFKLATAIGATRGDITDVEFLVGDALDDLAALEDDLDDANSMLNDIEDTVNDIEGDTSSLGAELDAIDSDLANLDSDIANVKSSLQTRLDNVKDNLAARIEELSLQETLESFSLPIMLAIILSLIAAVAAVIAVIQLMRTIVR